LKSNNWNLTIEIWKLKLVIIIRTKYIEQLRLDNRNWTKKLTIRKSMRRNRWEEIDEKKSMRRNRWEEIDEKKSYNRNWTIINVQLKSITTNWTKVGRRKERSKVMIYWTNKIHRNCPKTIKPTNIFFSKIWKSFFRKLG